MPRFPLALLLALVTAACSTAVPIGRDATVEAGPRHPIASAIAYDHSGALWMVERQGESCALIRVGEDERERLPTGLASCPDRLVASADRGILIGERGHLVRSVGEPGPIPAGLLESPRNGSELTIDDGRWIWDHDGRRRTIEAAGLRARRFSRDGNVLVASRSESSGETLVRVEEDGGLRAMLPHPVPVIDSFDLSPDGKEAVFSADRGSGFDVGLVSTDGSEIRWISPEQADEVMVSWAPRGNKVTYLIRTSAGSLLRSVHIPTGVSLTVDLGMSELRRLSWEPKAERFALLIESPERSPHVITMRYGGEEREVVIPPASTVPLDLDVLAGTAGLYYAPPMNPRYGRRYPLVIWLDEADRFAWRPWAAAIRSSEAAGVVFGARIDDLSDERFRAAIADLRWVERVYVVSPRSLSRSEIEQMALQGGTVLMPAAGGVPAVRNMDVVRITDARADRFERDVVAWIIERGKEAASANEQL